MYEWLKYRPAKFSIENVSIIIDIHLKISQTLWNNLKWFIINSENTEFSNWNCVVWIKNVRGKCVPWKWQRLKVSFEIRGKNHAKQLREFEIRLKMKMLDTLVIIFESLCYELCPLFKQLSFNGTKRSCVQSALCMFFSSNQWLHFSNGKNFLSCIQLVQVIVFCDHSAAWNAPSILVYKLLQICYIVHPFYCIVRWDTLLLLYNWAIWPHMFCIHKEADANLLDSSHLITLPYFRYIFGTK